MADRDALFRRHFADVCLDVRRLRTARVYDQKVTPDVVSAVAEVISEIAPDGRAFSIQSVWDSDQFKEAATVIFGKADPSNPLAGKEYNKFIGQPLLALRHAGVLSGRKAGRAWEYRIVNPSICREIASSEMAALDFLAEDAMKIFTDSGLGEEVARFFQKQDKPSLKKLEGAFNALCFAHTGIKNKAEIGRIFPKLLNVPAFKRQSRGRIGGHLSRGRITLYDIRYNRINWRDANKPKEITRREFQDAQPERRPGVPARIASAMRDVKAFHGGVSEIMDSHSGGGIVEAHHIFPRSDYPELAMVRENIILLAPTQHSAAHRGGRAKAYQMSCLLRKLEAVEKCEIDGGNFYSMSDFIGMLFFCGILDANSAKSIRHKFQEPADSREERRKIIRQVADDLRRFLTEHYVSG